MLLRSVEDTIQLVTSQVLDAYAAYVLASALPSPEQQRGVPSGEDNEGDTQAPERRDAPRSLEEVLCPLEVLFGKTALSAVGIALHGTERIIRYVERQSPQEGQDEEGVTRSTSEPEEGADRCVKDCRRYLYRVGEHTLFSPYYCPCSAYSFQSIRREEAYYCKHLLALQLALRLEGTGVPQDSILIREIDAVTFEALILNEVS